MVVFIFVVVFILSSSLLLRLSSFLRYWSFFRDGRLRIFMKEGGKQVCMEWNRKTINLRTRIDSCMVDGMIFEQPLHGKLFTSGPEL